MKNILNRVQQYWHRPFWLIVVLFACVPVDEILAPEVTTSGTSGLTTTSANEFGAASGYDITRKGIVYNQTGDPDITDLLVIAEPGSFIVEITNLEPDTRDFYRAFAQNSAGISFGSERDFTTEKEQVDSEDSADDEDSNSDFLDILGMEPASGANHVEPTANIVVEFDESVDLSTITEPGQSGAPFTGQKWDITLADGASLRMQNKNPGGSYSLDCRFVDMKLMYLPILSFGT